MSAWNSLLAARGFVEQEIARLDAKAAAIRSGAVDTRADECWRARNAELLERAKAQIDDTDGESNHG